MRLETDREQQLPDAGQKKSVADYSRRALLRIGGNIGVLVLAACSGIGPTLRQRNPFAEKLTPEETEVLEKLYAALGKLDQYIENFARDVARMDADKMTIGEAEHLELRLSAMKELLGDGLTVRAQLSERREDFNQAINYLRQTAMRDLAEKFTVVAQGVKMITESVYTKHLAALTDDNFEREVLKNSDIYIVMVSAEWCPRCYDALPLTAKFGRKRIKGVKIGRAILEDAEGNTANPKMKAFFRGMVPGFPAYVVFVKGRPTGLAVGGLHSLEDFERIVQLAIEDEPEIPPPSVEPDDGAEPEIPPPQMEPDDDVEPEIKPKLTPTGPVIEA